MTNDGIIYNISIHALREEGDRLQNADQGQQGNFYPRPPRGGRLTAKRRKGNRNIFLSTPSARRATMSLERWWQ